MTSTGSLTLVFLAGFGLCLGAAEILLQGFLGMGRHLRLAPGMVGLLAALGTDSPEIVSALSAIVHGDRDIGIGIVFGSNLFNLAALLGVSLLIAGRVTIPRAASLVDGAAALLVTAIGALLVASAFHSGLVLVLLLAVFFLYLLLLSVKPAHLSARLPRRVRTVLRALTRQIHAQHTLEDHPRPSRRTILLIPVSLAAIVIGATVMVDSALVLGPRLGIPRVLLGTVILAGLTSLPDAYAALRLALNGQGAALVSECLNSNTINIVIGAGIPAAVLGSLAVGPDAVANVLWLMGLTALVVAIFAWRVQVGRLVGMGIVAGYGAFLAYRFLA